MYMRSLAMDKCAEGIISVVINPGWVCTDMGGKKAPLSPTESVRSMLAAIDRLTLADSGKFFDWQGQEQPW